MHLRREILIFRNFAIFLLITLLVSCGSKEVKPVSEDSKITQEAFTLAEIVIDAYINDNRATLESNFTKDGYRELITDIKIFDSAELTFTPTWVEIEDSVVSITVSWKGTWTVSGEKKEERGVAVFVFEERPLKLSHVLKENP